jgi:hypothetical protein
LSDLASQLIDSVGARLPPHAEMLTAYGDFSLVEKIRKVPLPDNQRRGLGYECCLSGDDRFMKKLIAAYPTVYRPPFFTADPVSMYEAATVLCTLSAQGAIDMLTYAFKVLEMKLPIYSLMEYPRSAWRGSVEATPSQDEKRIMNRPRFVVSISILQAILVALENLHDPHNPEDLKNRHKEIFDTLSRKAKLVGSRAKSLADLMERDPDKYVGKDNARSALGYMLLVDAPADLFAVYAKWPRENFADAWNHSKDDPQLYCDTCGRKVTSTTSACAGCRSVHYCCRGCQAKVWPYHKVFCKSGSAPAEKKRYQQKAAIT